MPTPSPEAIREAAECIRRGGLVAFPTETVYGLGANVFDRSAVRRIYEVKARPPTSPLIVHVASVDQARELVTAWPAAADRLTARFWPGPLTLVLPKHRRVPEEATAGLPTVGVRMPAHAVALELIRAAGVPIAAPSANPFARLSPTQAEHVGGRLREQVDFILDAGSTPVGIESTVLSLATAPPSLLRPGVISQPEIESLVGPIVPAGPVEGAHPSPGMHPKHYAPVTPLVLVRNGALPVGGRGAYLWIRQPASAAKSVPMPEDARAYAARLYSTLHDLDCEGWDWIAVEAPPEGPDWAGIRDRLYRAAGELSRGKGPATS